jgi:hypothetical protein
MIIKDSKASRRGENFFIAAVIVGIFFCTIILTPILTLLLSKCYYHLQSLLCFVCIADAYISSVVVREIGRLVDSLLVPEVGTLCTRIEVGRFWLRFFRARVSRAPCIYPKPK